LLWLLRYTKASIVGRLYCQLCEKKAKKRKRKMKKDERVNEKKLFRDEMRLNEQD
jgi:hypothetical protein